MSSYTNKEPFLAELEEVLEEHLVKTDIQDRKSFPKTT